ncbi:DALR domain-containing protein [Variovorax sp. J22R115]|uniref:DALR domain-containing protein n=1 Tax=Variovorax sp. J22R115 TaxID=3053509 RepID=UPI002578AC8E|nr:DALR domain-containing protein [Variovorax sp. J22R115]MDM0053774.1 hypothetical protein [Variovorax sp. J22R115]
MAVANLKAQAQPAARRGDKIAPFIELFDAAVSDDLNTAVALTVLEDVVAAKKINPTQRLAAIAGMDAVLGLVARGSRVWRN